MAKLIAKSAGDGLLPVLSGTVTLSETDLGSLTSVSPFRGQVGVVSNVLTKEHGMAFPAPGRATGKAGARCIWFGKDEALLAGPSPSNALQEHAALTDQSDAWVSVLLEGSDAEAVLARLCPVNLRRKAFKRGHTARAQIQHINASITRVGDDSFLILAFRSMARTLVHDLSEAMQSVSARKAG